MIRSEFGGAARRQSSHALLYCQFDANYSSARLPECSELFTVTVFAILDMLLGMI